MDKEQQRKWLEAINDLKRQYYIGSLEAFQYLKTRHWLESLRRDIIIQCPEVEEKHELTHHQLAWLVSCFGLFAELAIRESSIRVSTPDDFSLRVYPTVVLPQALGEVQYETWHENRNDMWFADPTEYLSGFLTSLHSLSNVDEVATLMYKDVRMAWLLDLLCLQHRGTGKWVVCSQFCDQPKYRVHDSVAIWPLVDVQLIGHKSGHLKVRRYEYRDLKLAFAYRDLALAHAALKSINARLLAEREVPRTIQNVIDDGTQGLPAAEGWLYDSDVYERAEREYTLGQTEVQRRILLSAFMPVFGAALEKGLTPVAMVDACIESQREGISNLRLQLEHGKTLESTSFTSGIERALTEVANSAVEKALAQERYLYQALQENKKWLIEFLSR